MQRVTVHFPSLLELIAFTTSADIANFEINKAQCWLSCQLSPQQQKSAVTTFGARVLEEEPVAENLY
ncbi:MAG: hypothetical protein WKF70_05920 [Chitinophagaceae bacterium]